jgi:hypothetical protein
VILYSCGDAPPQPTERSTSGRSWSTSQCASFWTNPIIALHHTSSVPNRSTLYRNAGVEERLQLHGQLPLVRTNPGARLDDVQIGGATRVRDTGKLPGASRA